MREFVLPFKPEELLAQPNDGRLWAADLPRVDDWPQQKVSKSLDALVGRLVASKGQDLAEDKSFSLVYALLQAWPRLDDISRPRVADLLADAARRMISEVVRLRKGARRTDDTERIAAEKSTRTASKVIVFFLKWAFEQLLRSAQAEAAARRGGKGSRRGGADAESTEEAREAQRVLDRLRCALLGELCGMLGKGAMPWLWMGDPAAWQQVAQNVSDAGFVILDSADALKHRETRQLSLRCIAEPLLQEGHEHSNLLVAAVSRLTHSLRGPEGAPSFAADVLLLAHSTPLPRLLLVELTQHCTAAELTSQGSFQRALGSFLTAVAERLPNVVLANISVLLPLLDVDCYPLRSAIVESMGHLLQAEGKKLPAGAKCGGSSDKSGGAEKQGADEAEELEGQAADKGAIAYFHMASSTRRDLLDTLTARTMDKAVWVRVRALQTLQSLAANVSAAAIPREQWARVLQIASQRMYDCASSVRRASMQLVRTLIEFHPYGPALQGSGDERAKAEQLLREVHERLKQLQAEEVKEAEAEAAGMGSGTEADLAHAAAQDDEGEELVDPNQDALGGSPKRRRFAKKTLTAQTVQNEVDQFLADEAEVGCPSEERTRKREALQRMQECYSQRVQFVELIDAAEARIRDLLVSRTTSDVTEAISVVVELRLRGLPAAAQAFNQVLGLVWSRNAPIKDAAVEAFNRMHLEGRDTCAAMQMLLEMYRNGCTEGGWTYTHLASVQELIQQAAEKGLVDHVEAVPELIKALKGSTCSMALRALTALSAASWAELIKSLPCIAELFSPGGASVGTDAPARLERARLLAQLLQRMHSCSKGTLEDEAWTHLWALCQYVTRVVVEHYALNNLPPQWFGAAQSVMDLAFDLATSATDKSDPLQRCPDKLWDQLLGRMLSGILPVTSESHSPVLDNPPLMDDEIHAEVGAAPEAPLLEVPEQLTVEQVASTQVGCVVFVAGHLAMRMLVYLENLQGSLKKKRMSDEDARIAEQREKNKKKSKKAKGAKQEDEEEDDNGTEAAGMGMAGLEEREAEAFAELAEQALLFGGQKSLLNRITPLIFSCLLNPSLREDPVLRRVGAISLCKFMAVSKRFCEEHLQLLFSVLFPKSKEKQGLVTADSTLDDLGTGSASNAGVGALLEDHTLRQSLLVAVGDLLFRHPNVVEPWTDRLYSALGSPTDGSSDHAANSELRLTALLVLTHLVLNDMMKPRAVLLVRALWLTACPHDPTARVARILFQELSKRTSNVVYNLLPEIIARLPELEDSAGSVSGGAEARVRFVMQFIEKEKQLEGLIEKLSLRLEQSANEAGGLASSNVDTGAAAEQMCNVNASEHGATCNDRANQTVSCLAHALGSMSYTDRCILRLHDVVVVRKGLHIALSYHSVARDCITNVVEKARKPRAGKNVGGGAPSGQEAEDTAAGNANAESTAPKGGMSPAAAAALDAIEKTVLGLARGQDEVPIDPPKPIDDGSVNVAQVVDGATVSSHPSSSSSGTKGGVKRKNLEQTEDADEAMNGKAGSADADAKESRRRGAGRGRAGGRGSGSSRAGGDDVTKDLKQGGKGTSGRGQRGKRGPACRAAVAEKRRGTSMACDDDYED